MIAETRTKSKQICPKLQTHDVFILRDKQWRMRIQQIRYRCGHRDQRGFEINLFGRVVRRDCSDMSLCGDCLALRLKSESIRCIRCGTPIFDTEFTTHYEVSRTMDVPMHARVLVPADYYPGMEIPRLLLGCGDSFCMPRGVIATGQLRDGLVRSFDERLSPFRIPLLSNWVRTPYMFPLVQLHQTETV